MALTFFSLIDRLNQGFSFSLVKRRAGLSALAFVGLLLISGIAMAILKSAKRPVSPTVLNFFRLFHAVSIGLLSFVELAQCLHVYLQ